MISEPAKIKESQYSKGFEWTLCESFKIQFLLGLFYYLRKRTNLKKVQYKISVFI